MDLVMCGQMFYGDKHSLIYQIYGVGQNKGPFKAILISNLCGEIVFESDDRAFGTIGAAIEWCYDHYEC